MHHVSLPLCQHPASNFLHSALKGKTNTPLLLHLFFVQKPMKPKLLWCSLFIIIFFVLAVSATSARPLVQSQGGDEKPKQILERALDSKLEDNSIDELMGSETCGDADEECLKRRLLSEAHLDYIYTQEHKP